MSDHDRSVERNELIERDKKALALKRYAARILAENHQGDHLRQYYRDEYIHTVRALQDVLAQMKYDDRGLGDTTRNIEAFRQQELGIWDGSNPGASAQTNRERQEADR